MRNYIFVALAFCIMLYSAFAQETQTFKGIFFNKENNITIHIDLQEETVNIPGLDILGSTNGYMNGNIYGTWIVTKSKISDNAATIRFSNDFGSEAQELKMTCISPDTFLVELQNPQVLRKVVKRKLVKVPQKYIFIKSKKRNVSR